MLAVTVDGYSLIAFIVLIVAVVFIVVVAARLLKREHNVKVAKLGFYIERERFDGETPKPIPPPTPCPPPPPPEDETAAWPTRSD